MTDKTSNNRNRLFLPIVMGISLIIAGLISSFASENPDGFDRVAQDLKFEDQAVTEPPAQKLPFATVFEEYSLKGVPSTLATPLAGIIGTVATFGVTWGVGKLLIRRSSSPSSNREASDSN